MKEKILLVKLGSLGDVLMTTPVISVLKKNFPDSELYFLTSNTCKKLLVNNPKLAGVLAVDELGTSSNPFLEIIRVLWLAYVLLRNRKFDRVFVFHRSLVLDLILRIVLRGRLYSFKSGAEFDLSRHRIMRNIDMLKKAYADLEYEMEDLKLEFFPAPVEPIEVEKPYVVIAPGGGKNVWSEMKTRRWPVEDFIQLAEKINSHLGLNVVFAGGPDECFPLPDEEKLRNLVGKTTFDQLSLLLREAELFIGNDSFALFLAAAAGCRTLGIFGPTNSNLINPFGKEHIAIQSGVKCSPCFNPIEGTRGRAYACSDPVCMKEITVEAVFEKAADLLGGKAARA
jgi:ADP-heptose:LPS heptosyltransferase